MKISRFTYSLQAQSEKVKKEAESKKENQRTTNAGERYQDETDFFEEEQRILDIWIG